MAENNIALTQDIIDQCKIELCKEKVAATNIWKAKCTDEEMQNEELLCSLYCYNTTNDMLDLYCGIDFSYAMRVIKGKELLKGNIESLMEKNDALGSQYKDLVKLIREMRQNYTDVLDEACKLGRCLEEEERCNPDTFKELAKVDGLVDNVNALEEEARNCYETICHTFDAAIDIAGIQTFTNIQSLIPYCDNLNVLLANLRKDMDTNIAYLNTQLTKDKKSVGTALEEAIVADFEKCEAQLGMETASEIFEYVCDPACGSIPEGENTIEEICKKLKKDLGAEDDECLKLQAGIESGELGTEEDPVSPIISTPRPEKITAKSQGSVKSPVKQKNEKAGDDKSKGKENDKKDDK